MQVYYSSLFQLVSTCVFNLTLLTFLNRYITISSSYATKVIICDVFLCYVVNCQIFRSSLSYLVNYFLRIFFNREGDTFDYMQLIVYKLQKVVEVPIVVLCSNLYMILMNIILITDLHLYVFYILTYLFTSFSMMIILALLFIFISLAKVKLYHV